MQYSNSSTRRGFLQAAAASATACVWPASLSNADDTPRKLVGVTVLPEYIQSEGIDGLLHNLIEVVGANCVATSPYVMAEASMETGSREPPADAGAGTSRLLDRPLFGKREVWVRTSASFVPNASLYEGQRYQPPAADELTHTAGGIVSEFVTAAQAAGLKVFFQIQAAIPPCYRVQFGGPIEDDIPTLPDGRTPERRVSRNGSLASPHIQEYVHALIRDLFDQYPTLDGLRFDWPEHPPYLLDSAFLDFSPHVEHFADEHGFDFAAVRTDVGRVYAQLHGQLTNHDLERWLADDGGRFALLGGLIDSPGVLDWLRLKAMLVEQLLAGFRDTMTRVAGEERMMLPNAFPPPFTLVSGFDFTQVGRLSDGISCKLYTMHWPMILRFYGDQLLAANPGLSEDLLTRSLVKLLDIADDAGLPHLEDYAYPDPETPHPVGTQAMTRKIEQAQAAAGDCPVYSLAHGYGPLEDYHRRLVAAWTASPHGLWMNRYAYLTDEKLRLLGDVVHG